MKGILLGCLISGLLLISCSPYQYGFRHNVKVKGYVIYTNSELLDNSGGCIGPSPRIEYFFIPDRFVIYNNDKYIIKEEAHFYELRIENKDCRDYYYHYGDTIYYDNGYDQEGKYYSYRTLITESNLLIKKINKGNCRFLKHYEYYNLDGHYITFNHIDTISIKMSYGFMFVNDLDL